MAVLLVYEDRSYIRSAGETLESDLGVLDIPEDVAPGQTVETHLGEAFHVREIRGPDCFEHFERTGAPMLPRDVGLILGETGVSSRDRVLDAGTGTGVLAAYMGLAGADVLTFERDPDAAAVARENFAMVGLEDRIDVRSEDAVESFQSGGLDRFDVLTLDTADAPELVRAVPDVLKPGGFLAVYSPFVEDAREVVERAAPVVDSLRTIETIQRELDIDARGTRPSTGPVGHSGYLTIGRRG